MITGKTAIVGILGHPVGHTLSPAMQNAAFDALDLDYCYLPFDVLPDRLADAVLGLRALGVCGVNVTIPHKETILPFMDRLTVEAHRIGAVNTVEVTKEGLVGHNTDGRGFLRSLQEEGGMNPAGKKVLILGAGGAARAVAVQLAMAGATSIRIMNRTPERGRVLAGTLQSQLKDLPIEAIPWLNRADEWTKRLAETDLVVNATSVGMEGDLDTVSPLPTEALHAGLLVCDLVYRPLDTPLLQAARSRGAATISGLGMLLYQGALSFEIWTGRPAPVSVMREALISALKLC